MKKSPPVSPALAAKIEKRIRWCLQTLSRRGFFRAPPPMPTIKYDLRGTSAGEACSGGTLRFNPVYLRHYTAHFIEHTVAHEVAHYADFLRRGRSDHGPRWQALMRALDLDPTTTHPYELPLSAVSRLQTFTYRCACRLSELTSIRHKRSQITARAGKPPLYYCTQCRAPLVYAPRAQALPPGTQLGLEF